MKKDLTITSPNERLIDAALEEYINQRHRELQEMALTKSKHFAKDNRPCNGDHLNPFIGDTQRGYEKLSADVQQKLQTSSHFTDAKMEADFFNHRNTELDEEIQKLTAENHNDELQIEKFNHADVPTRLRWIVVFSLGLFVGEVVYNTNALQIIGENLLFSMLLSIAITMAILLLAHFTTVLYKKCISKSRRRLVLAGSIVLATTVFIGLGFLRYSYLKSHGTDVSPVFFVVFNLLFYIVALLLSFFVHPSKEELAHHIRCKGICKKIKERIDKILLNKNEKEKMKKEFLEKSLFRMRVIHYSNALCETIRKMYKETVEIFKSNNLALRTDRKTPDCFHDIIPEPEITPISNNYLNRKAS